MRSFDSTHTVRLPQDSATSEGSITNPTAALRGATTADPTPPVVVPAAGSGSSVITICPSCGAPLGPPHRVLVPEGVRHTFPLGPNGGIIIRRRLPGSDEWLAIEYLLPDDNRDTYLAAEPELGPKVAAIELGTTLKSLYARAPYLASAEKRGRRWVFHRDVLLETDLPAEHARPTRRDVVASRAARRRAGGCQRPGSHAWGCDGRHAGPCSTSRRRVQSMADRERTSQSILDDLGR